MSRGPRSDVRVGSRLVPRHPRSCLPAPRGARVGQKTVALQDEDGRDRGSPDRVIAPHFIPARVVPAQRAEERHPRAEVWRGRSVGVDEWEKGRVPDNRGVGCLPEGDVPDLG